MKFKDLKAKIDSNWLSRNLVRGVIYVLALMLVTRLLLVAITQHDIKVKVPDFSGKTVAEAGRVASRAGVKLHVVDSVYVNRLRKGAIFVQNPQAGTRVKRGRTIYLTTNAMRARQVTMPDLVGLSMRQAKSELGACGLTLGELVYVPDMATNNVLDQLYGGKPVAKGTTLDAGSVIDLKLGLNRLDGYTQVPDLSGDKYLDAVSHVHDNSLNVSKLVFDSSVKSYADSLNAFVYKQVPPASTRQVRMGTTIRLQFTLDKNKLQQNSSAPSQRPDTIQQQ